MGTVVLPKLSQTGTNEWADVEDNDKALRDEFNGNIENVNIKSSAAIAHSKLADATAGYVLMGNSGNTVTATAISGDATLSSAGALTLAVPICVLAQTSSVATNNTDKETWASESIDTDTMHSTSANTSRITIQTAGVYRIQASVWFDDTLDYTAPDMVILNLYLNGTRIAQKPGNAVNIPGEGSNGSAYVDIDATFSCAASSYFEVNYFQNGSTSSATKRFTATYIGAAS